MSITVHRFIDPHCHMFTAADLPLYEAAMSSLDLNHPLAVLIPLALGAKRVRSTIRSRRPLLRFLEQEPSGTPAAVRDQIRTALTSEDIKAREIIATPLVMDFDLNGRVEKLRGQVDRLLEAVDGTSGLKVLPFLGLDPRRFVFDSAGDVRTKRTMLRHLRAFLDEFPFASPADRRDAAKVKSGEMIGIKMYPPLGFDPLPDEARARERHLDLYEELCEQELPLTVHCQPTSFSMVKRSETLRFTHPKKWVAVLDGLQARRTSRPLRINFAHFGGDGGMGRLMRKRSEWRSFPPNQREMQRSSWTWHIWKALTKHPGAFADVSAIDFSHGKRGQGALPFLWLLKFDADRRAPAGERLIDRLMWGSDYPMTVTTKTMYAKLLGDFLSVGERYAGKTRAAPPAGVIPDRAELIDLLCCRNPQRFLFQSQ